MHLRSFALLLACTVLPLRAVDPPPGSPAVDGSLRKSGLPAAGASVTLPLQDTMAGFTVEAHIDGKPVSLVLDTGAVCTILSPATVRKLGLEGMQGNIPVETFSGEQVVRQPALTRRIGLGGAWTENEPVLVSETHMGIDGLLGVSTLADWDVRIDPSRKELTLFPAGKAPPLEGETTLALQCDVVDPAASGSHPQGFRPIHLSLPARVGRQELRVKPDTGYGGGILQLSSALMRKLAPEAMKEARPGLVSGISLSGKEVTRTAKLPEFTFGPDTLRGLPLEVVEAPPGSLAESEGNVGMNLLRHYILTFRFAARELRLKPLGSVQELTRTSTAGINLGPDARILSVKPDGPAAKAGLRAGDELLEIEGHPLRSLTPEEFAAFKRLPPGSIVQVRYRRGESEPVEARLVLVKE